MCTSHTLLCYALDVCGYIYIYYDKHGRHAGATPLLDGGFAIACGVGIENCKASDLSATDLTNCKAGKGDLRAGAGVLRTE